MHQLGLTAADVAALIHGSREGAAASLAVRTKALEHAGHGPEEAARLALFELLATFAADLLEANNRKLATDLVRLGVLAGTISKEGEASF